MARLGLRVINKGLSARFFKMAQLLPNKVSEELHSLAEEMQGDFEKTTATWSHGVGFDVTELPGVVPGWGVSTTDEVWNWVDQGTAPHIIPGNPVLRFSLPFRAKTKAHTVSSYQGSVGSTPVVALEVHHPGVAAREFTETIVDRWQPKVAPRIRQALKDGIEAVGL